jgi:hypothetical protein
MFLHHDSRQTPSSRRAAFAARADEADDEAGGDSLEDAARDERRLARERLRAELGRDPTEEETSEWLRRQTEGY